MRGRVPQALLDDMAVAWSRLDRTRPTRRTEAGLLLPALENWMRLAVRIDDELRSLHGADHGRRGAAQPGGRAMAACSSRTRSQRCRASRWTRSC